jgi:hypothetical protein
MIKSEEDVTVSINDKNSIFWHQHSSSEKLSSNPTPCFPYSFFFLSFFISIIFAEKNLKQF